MKEKRKKERKKERKTLNYQKMPADNFIYTVKQQYYSYKIN